MEGVSTAKIVLFHQGSTELRRCENCIFFLPVNILTGVTRRLLGPHDTLPCVLIAAQPINYALSHETIKNSKNFFVTCILISQDNKDKNVQFLYKMARKVTKGQI